MSAEKRWRLICYDVRDPKRYRALYKLIRGHGRAVQYSIFRCRLDDRQLERLRWRLASILTSEDRLLVVDLCPTCAARVISKNHVEGWQEEPSTFEIVGKQAPADVEAAAAHESTNEARIQVESLPIRKRGDSEIE